MYMSGPNVYMFRGHGDAVNMWVRRLSRGPRISSDKAEPQGRVRLPSVGEDYG